MKSGTYVVTGGAGFLGSHLCDALLERGHRVICVDNFLTGAPANIAHRTGHDRFRFIKHDVTQDLYLPGPVDGVLHFASPASPRDYLEFPIQTLKVGALGTHKMLGLAKAKNARFLLASTSEVYGDPQVHPQTESYWGHVNPVGPRGVYDEAKRFAEAIAMAYHRSHGVRVRIARIFNTYGPRMRKNDGRAVPEFIAAVAATKPLQPFGDCGQTRSLCYVEDEAEGLLRLLFSSHVGPMNIGNPREISVLEIARLVKKLTHSPSRIVHRPLPVDDPKVRQPDIAYARRALKWAPTITLEEGLRRTIAWFRAPSR
jgi:dTDP-glucose 4,6-dehydratase